MKQMRTATGMFVIVLIACMCAGTAGAWAETITIGADKTVDQVVAFGKDIRIYGEVEGDAVSFGGNVYIESGGTVQEDAVAIFGDVSVRHGGEVEGDAVTIGGRIALDRMGTVEGSIVDVFDLDLDLDLGYNKFGHGPPNIIRLLFLGPFFGAFGIIGIIIGISISLVKVLISVAVAACITYFFPASIAAMSATTHRSFLKTFFGGLLMVVLIPFLLIGLVVTLIGIPLVPVFILFLTVCYLFGSVGVAAWVGELFPNAVARSPMRNAIIGVLMLALVKLIPGVGFLVGILVTLLSFGLVVITRFGSVAPQS